MEIFIDVCRNVGWYNHRYFFGLSSARAKNRRGGGKKRYSGFSEYPWVPDLDF